MIDACLVGKNLRKLRKGIGKQENEVALQIGITYEYMSQIELGKKLPSANLLVLFANYYGIGVNEIVQGDTNKNNETEHMQRIQYLLRHPLLEDKDLDFLYTVAQSLGG